MLTNIFETFLKLFRIHVPVKLREDCEMAFTLHFGFQFDCDLILGHDPLIGKESDPRIASVKSLEGRISQKTDVVI